jgi:hypothetical protein
LDGRPVHNLELRRLFNPDILLSQIMDRWWRPRLAALLREDKRYHLVSILVYLWSLRIQQSAISGYNAKLIRMKQRARSLTDERPVNFVGVHIIVWP